MTTIYRKTEKGITEIATRANRLVPRLRTALILVDGTRNEAELDGLIAQGSTQVLEELLSLGYIEPTPTAPTTKQEKTAAGVAPAGTDKSFASFRAEAMRALSDLTGSAGEALATKMEKTNSREQLAPLLQAAYQIIGTSRGAQAATEFKARFASF